MTVEQRTEKHEGTTEHTSVTEGAIEQATVLVKKPKTNEIIPNNEAKENLTLKEPEKFIAKNRLRNGDYEDVVIPLRFKVDDKELGKVLDFECTVEELEKLTTSKGHLVGHVWNNANDKGDFGEILGRLIVEKLRGWGNATEKGYEGVRLEGKKDLDLLMVDKEGYYQLMEVRAVFSNTSNPYFEDASERLVEAERMASLNFPGLKMKKHLICIKFFERKRNFPAPRIASVIKKGINYIEVTYPSTHKKCQLAYEMSEQGYTQAEIAEALKIKRKGVSKYIQYGKKSSLSNI